MNLLALEQEYDGFYAPLAIVTVGKKDIVRHHFLSLTRVEVDLKERAAGHFTFNVANAFDWESREFVAGAGRDRVDLIELFAFGSSVEIAFGYRDAERARTLLRGTISEVRTSFSEGGVPELTVSGLDRLYPLTVGKASGTPMENARDSEMVQRLVGKTGLSLDVRPTEPQRPRIEQTQQAGMSFLERLAKRNGATFYVQGDRFYFGPRNNEKTGILELGWGKGLLSFSPQANLAEQVESVEVRSRSASTGEEIVGRASRGSESGRDPGKRSGPEQVARAVNNQPALVVRAPAHTQAEADTLARSTLEERAQKFVTGDAESIGLPEIVPDINLTLSGLGKTFSKTYYVKSAKHKLDGSGYRTSFSVEETTL
jgi:phage protein D